MVDYMFLMSVRVSAAISAAWSQLKVLSHRTWTVATPSQPLACGPQSSNDTLLDSGDNDICRFAADGNVTDAGPVGLSSNPSYSNLL